MTELLWKRILQKRWKLDGCSVLPWFNAEHFCPTECWHACRFYVFGAVCSRTLMNLTSSFNSGNYTGCYLLRLSQSWYLVDVFFPPLLLSAE